MIIGAAIALAVSQAIRKIRGERKPAKKIDFKKETFSMHHDCSDCSAECMLRDSVKPVVKENIELCIKTEKNSEL